MDKRFDCTERLRRILGMTFIAVLMVLFSSAVFAVSETRFTVEYRGQAYIDGELVPDGTPITVWSDDGQILLDEAEAGYGQGYFNHLEIRWDDPSTFLDEGVAYDDVTKDDITFRIGGVVVDSPDDVSLTTHDRGRTFTLDLHARTGLVDVLPAGSLYQSHRWGLVLMFGLLIVLVLVFYFARRPGTYAREG